MSTTRHPPPEDGSEPAGPPRAAPFALRSIVERVAEGIRPTARKRNLSLMVFVAPEIPAQLAGEADRLEQVLGRLVTDAVRGSARGDIVLRATLEARTSDGVVVRFALHHSAQNGRPAPGGGRDERAGPAYSPRGLRTAFLERQIGLLGGELGTERQRGQDTVVWFTAPLERPTNSSSRRAGAKRELRVLVVDDNHAHREILHRYLRHWGLHSDSAGGGHDALTNLRHAAVAGEPYDIAILDFAMPGMNGFQLARAIREDDRMGATQLVLLTAFDELGQRDDALATGFAAYLTKPVRYAQLLETLERVSSAPADGQPH